MPIFDDVEAHNDALVRKALSTIVAVGPASADPITSILDAADGLLAPLPTGYLQLGRLTEDGSSFARETELSEIFGHGSSDPTRSDIRRSTKRATITCLEVRKRVLELSQGVESLGETGSLVGGSAQVTWDEPKTPTYPYLRAIFIAKDITAGGEIYVARHALKCKVTEAGEEMWSDQDQAMVTPLTFTFYKDNDAGTPLRHFRGGPGYAEIVTDEGFDAPA